MLNKVILIGRVGKDPEMKYGTSGDAIANFSLATSKRYKDKSGEMVEKTEWHNISAYRRLAEIIGEYVKKGALIYIEGEIHTRKWQDKDGSDRYSTGIVASEMTMLGGKDKGDEQATKPGKAPAVQDLPDDIPF